MIQVNLLPDVKQELIHAQRQRNVVVTIALFVAAGFVAVVILLALYVFGAQALRNAVSDGEIKKQSEQLTGVEDLDKSLTVQNQLTKISDIHSKTPINSRVFDVLTTVVPTTGDNTISVSNFSVDTANKTITIEGQTTKGYVALDAFKKTIVATKFQYNTADDNQLKTIPLTDKVIDGDRSYGEGENGQQVLRFTVSFTYPSELLDRLSLNGRVIAPQASNVTDSKLEIPSSLFTNGNGDN